MPISLPVHEDSCACLFMCVCVVCTGPIWACSKIMKPKRDIGGENETVVIGEIVTPNKLGVLSLKVFKIV